VFISDFVFHTLEIITKFESHLLWSWVHSSSKIYIHTSVLYSTNNGRHLIRNRYAANTAHVTVWYCHHWTIWFSARTLKLFWSTQAETLHSLFRLYNYDEKLRNWRRITLTIFKQPHTYYVTDIPVIDYKTLMIDQLMQFPPTTAISRFV